MKIVDLFSGLGGLTVGAIEAARLIKTSLEIEFACDMNKYCSDFYKENFESYLIDYHTGSILDVQTNSIKDTSVDYLFAGPPCPGRDRERCLINLSSELRSS